MVILLPFYDRTRAIELLHEDEAHHLVGEREARERDLLVGARIDRLGEAVGSSDGEDESARRGPLLLQPSRQFHGPWLASVLVEEHQRVGGLHLLQDQLPLLLLLLRLGERGRGPQFGYGDDLEGHVVADAVSVVVDGVGIEFVAGLPHKDERRFHL